MNKRNLGFVATCTLLLACAGLALAQMPPGDPKLGTQVAMMELNNSGMTGDVTLFGRAGGKQTLVVVHLEGAPHHPVPVSIHRSRSAFCDAIAPAVTYPLTELRNGKSATLLAVPIMKLLGRALLSRNIPERKSLRRHKLHVLRERWATLATGKGSYEGPAEKTQHDEADFIGRAWSLRC